MIAQIGGQIVQSRIDCSADPRVSSPGQAEQRGSPTATGLEQIVLQDEQTSATWGFPLATSELEKELTHD